MAALCLVVRYTSSNRRIALNKKLRSAAAVGLVLLVALRCVLWLSQALDVPVCLEAADHDLQLEVLAVKAADTSVIMLDARVVQVISAACRQLRGERLRLSWYYPEFTAHPGDLLRTTVRLRKPWGSRNPGGFDYGWWLLGQGYRASGYLRSVAAVNPPGHAAKDQFRLRVADGSLVYPGLINAIALGVRDGVTAEQWELFRATGTIHLMVVSGLHVGVFAGGVYLFAFGLLRLIRRIPPGWHARHLALLVSALAIAGLVYQTGLQAPVLRAALMAGAVIFTLLLSRHSSWWRSFFAITLLALLLQPRMLLQQGFWLSYAAVAALLFFFVHRAPQFSWVRGFCMCQWVLLLCLTPWVGLTAGEVPLVSPLANLLVVPLMSMVTIPLAMAGALLSPVDWLQPLSGAALWVADHSLALVVYLLQQLRGAAGSSGYFSAPRALQGILAGAVLLLPLGRGIRLTALLCWLTLFIAPPARIPAGEYRIIALDVGQGSAAIVDTARRRLVVDAGPAFASGFDSGTGVVVPALRATGRDNLQRLFISHRDNDHAGGASSVAARYVDADEVGLHRECRHGAFWYWDGVKFEVLVDRYATSSNDASCTLLISNGRRTAYLSGDIGAAVERRLIKQLPQAVDFLLAPHHGSTTSSSRSFVAHLCPRFVVFTAGRRNRYGHPRARVTERYQRAGSVSVVTGLSGAVTWRSDRPLLLSSMRDGVRRASGLTDSCPPRRSSAESR
jgi:competence protein ComEC